MPFYYDKIKRVFNQTGVPGGDVVTPPVATYPGCQPNPAKDCKKKNKKTSDLICKLPKDSNVSKNYVYEYPEYVDAVMKDCQIPGSPTIVTAPKPTTGYVVEKWVTSGGGLGLSTQAYFDNATGFIRKYLTFNLGLERVKNQETLVRYTVANERDVDTVVRNVPDRAEEISTWAIGDSVFYESQGGALFLAGAGSPYLSAGGYIATLGVWNVYVEKIDQDRIYVNMIQSDLRDNAVFVNGAVILTLSKSQIESIGKGFSFEFDLKDAAARDAFEKMIKGNMQPAQEMSLQNGFSAIKRVESMNYVYRGKNRTFVLGIPFWNKRSYNGEFHNLTTTNNVSTQLDTVSEYGIFKKLNAARFFNAYHKNIDKMFTGGLATTYKDGKATYLDSNGTFIWSYEEVKAHSDDLARALKELRAQTALESIDYSGEVPKNIGYLRVKFTYYMSSSFVGKLMTAKGKSSKFSALSLATLERDAMGYVNTMSKNADFEKTHCQRSSGNCTSALENEIRNSFAVLDGHLNVMSRTYQRNGKAYAVAFQKLGKEVWNNEFVLKAFMEKSKICGGTYSLEISGRKISQQKTDKAWKSDYNKCL